MLSVLHIENIAVIESADIAFAPGFNALTGETGAGKSIVVDAMGAVTGERASRELIRTGAKSAFVTGTFTDLGPLPYFAESGISPDPARWAQSLPGQWPAGDGGPAAGSGPAAAQHPRSA